MLLVLALAACAVTLAGCGGGKKKTAQQPTTLTRSTTPGTTTTTATPPKPVASFTESTSHDDGPVNLRVSIYDLRREGPYLVLDFGISCADSGGCNPIGAFQADSEGSTTGQILDCYSRFSLTASGITLVDPAQQKQYLPVRDSRCRPFTSQLELSMNGSTTYLAWARYPAPPASVTSLDVTFPDGGPQMPNVPISSGPAPTATGGLVAAQPAPFDQPPDSTDTTGLTLPVKDLVATVGNTTGSASESPRQATVTLRSDVLFHFAKSSLTPRAHGILKSIAAQIKSRALGAVQVTGYTDSIGSEAVNIPLSEARARSVVDALQPQTPGVVYHSAGKGEADPVAPNTKPDGSDNPAGRALNRRVTVAFAVKAPARPTPPPAPATAQSLGSATGQTVSFTEGSREVSLSHYRLTVNSLFREGSLLVARLTITCTGTNPSSNACGPIFELAGSQTTPPQPPLTHNSNWSLQAANTISGFYLFDPATGSMYIPVHTTDGVPVAGGIGNLVDAGLSYQTWAYFPAPPPTVPTITLVAPNGAAKLGGLAIAPGPPAP